MAHTDEVIDKDDEFLINPITREITNQSDKNTLMQFDHNSERLTFALPLKIDGHDMTECNRVEVHFINIPDDNGTPNQDMDVIDRPVEDPNDPETALCSWLIKDNATQLVGSLNFVIRFKCINDKGETEYSWNTAICSALSISNGIDSGKAAVTKAEDVLAEWYKDLVAAGGEGVNMVENHVETVTKPAIDKYAKEQVDQLVSDAGILDAAKEYVDETAVISKHKEMTRSSSRLYAVKGGEDFLEAPRSNTDEKEAAADANINTTGVDNCLGKEDVQIYKSTIMRRDSMGRSSILDPELPKHIANKAYVDKKASINSLAQMTVGNPSSIQIVYDSIVSTGVITESCETRDFIKAMDRPTANIEFPHSTKHWDAANNAIPDIHLTDIPEEFGYVTLSWSGLYRVRGMFYAAHNSKVYVYTYRKDWEGTAYEVQYDPETGEYTELPSIFMVNSTTAGVTANLSLLKPDDKELYTVNTGKQVYKFGNDPINESTRYYCMHENEICPINYPDYGWRSVVGYRGGDILESLNFVSNTRSCGGYIQRVVSDSPKDCGMNFASCEDMAVADKSTVARSGIKISHSAAADVKDRIRFFASNSVDDPTLTWYRLYGEHNKPTPADIGALSTGGGTITNNLVIEKATYPTVMLNDPAGGKGVLQYNANEIYLMTKNDASDNNRRQLVIKNSAKEGSVAESLKFYDTVNGKTTPYNIYGTHNLLCDAITSDNDREAGANVTCVVQPRYVSSVVKRDGAGRSSIQDPTAPKHIANKKYVDECDAATLASANTYTEDYVDAQVTTGIIEAAKEHVNTKINPFENAIENVVFNGGSMYLDYVLYYDMLGLPRYYCAGIGKESRETVKIPQSMINNQLAYINEGAFKDKSTIKHLEVLNMGTAPTNRIALDINESAFENTGLQTVSIVDRQVGTIGKNAFGRNKSLTTVTLPDTVGKISSGAFVGDTALSEICIPDNTDVEYGAFDKNTKVTVKDTAPGLRATMLVYENVLYGIRADTNGDYYTILHAPAHKMAHVLIKNGVREIPKDCFSNSTTLTTLDLTLCTTPVAIAECAFDRCHNLTTVYINNLYAPTGIHPFAFDNTSCTIKTSNVTYLSYKENSDAQQTYRIALYIESDPAIQNGQVTKLSDVTRAISHDALLGITSGTGHIIELPAKLRALDFSGLPADTKSRIATIRFKGDVTDMNRLLGTSDLTTDQLKSTWTNRGYPGNLVIEG